MLLVFCFWKGIEKKIFKLFINEPSHLPTAHCAISACGEQTLAKLQLHDLCSRTGARKLPAPLMWFFFLITCQLHFISFCERCCNVALACCIFILFSRWLPRAACISAVNMWKQEAGFEKKKMPLNCQRVSLWLRPRVITFLCLGLSVWNRFLLWWMKQ